MSERMKVLITAGYADICVRVPETHAAKVQGVLENLLALIPDDDDQERLYSIEEVFPDMHAGDILRGARYREALTQAQLAEKVKVKPSHISEMERGKRPIGKDMAKRLAEALNTSYKVFL
jgi:DNA-binding XRE family transcriptional regulator